MRRPIRVYNETKKPIKCGDYIFPPKKVITVTIETNSSLFSSLRTIKGLLLDGKIAQDISGRRQIEKQINGTTFCSLNEKKLEDLLQVPGPQTNIPPAKEGDFLKWLRNKRVVLIGPAGYYQEPSDLDFDVFIRVNHSIRLGKRTDVLYLNSGLTLKSAEVLLGHNHIPAEGEPVKFAQICIEESVTPEMWREMLGSCKWVLSKSTRIGGQKIGAMTLYCKNWCKMNKHFQKHVKKQCKTDPNLCVYVIAHLLRSQLKSLNVYGVDFFASMYQQDYYPPDNIHHSVYSKTAEEFEKEERGFHNWGPQKKYLKGLAAKDKRLLLDNTLKKVIKAK